jgi:hypothetical protein
MPSHFGMPNTSTEFQGVSDDMTPHTYDIGNNSSTYCVHDNKTAAFVIAYHGDFGSTDDGSSSNSKVRLWNINVKLTLRTPSGNPHLLFPQVEPTCGKRLPPIRLRERDLVNSSSCRWRSVLGSWSFARGYGSIRLIPLWTR